MLRVSSGIQAHKLMSCRPVESVGNVDMPLLTWCGLLHYPNQRLHWYTVSMSRTGHYVMLRMVSFNPQLLHQATFG